MADGAGHDNASVRLGVCFGDIPGPRFLNDEITFNGTPAGFDAAIEKLRVAFHEAASAAERPDGWTGPWWVPAGWTEAA